MEGRKEEGVESRQVISWNSTSRLFSQNQERMSSFSLGQNNIAVADPGLQIRGVGGGGRGSHPDPEIRGGGGGLKKIFFGPSGLNLV